MCRSFPAPSPERHTSLFLFQWNIARQVDRGQPIRGVVHHIDLTVVDPDASFALYDTVLKELGYQLKKKDERGFDWALVTVYGTHSIGLVRASQPNHAYDRYSPGLHHLAWTMDNRADIDRMHRLLVSINATVLHAPAEYPQYNDGKGYYAVFFADPDGLKLECVYTPRDPRTSRH